MRREPTQIMEQQTEGGGGTMDKTKKPLQDLLMIAVPHRTAYCGRGDFRSTAYWSYRKVMIAVHSVQPTEATSI